MVDKYIKQTHCRMCGEHCGINVHFENDKIVKISGTKEHHWNRGRLCPKGKMGIDFVTAPDRILKPLKKVNNDWQEIDLETALDEIAQKITEIKRLHGDRSLGLWKGEAVGFAQQEALARRFIRALGSPNYFSGDSACINGRIIGYRLTAGGFPKPDLWNSKCILFWGINPPASHPMAMQHIMAAKNNGAKLIVVDSRYSSMAAKADIFAQIKPGTDGALAHGIMRALINSNSINKPFVDNYTIGYERLKKYVQPFTPEMVQNETGLDATLLRQIADIIGEEAPKVVNYVGNGLEHHENGVNNIRAVACISGLIGAFDAKGGNFFPESMSTQSLSLYSQMPLRHLDPIGAKEYPVLYDMVKECHTMTAMNTFISGKPYPVKGLILTAANPVLTNPNSNKVRSAFENLDLLVVREMFMSETAKLADYILPNASYLERSELHYHGIFQTVGISEKVITLPGVQGEYEFYHSMAQRLEIEDYFPWKNEEDLNEWLLKPSGVSVEEIKSHPEGFVYKPIQYEKYKTDSKGFHTPSGKIEFISSYLKEMGYEELPEYKSPAYLKHENKEYPFVLITGARKLTLVNSRYQNIKKALSNNSAPEMEIHASDARQIGLKNGDIVKVISKVGELELPIKIMEGNEILQGVIQITHGWKNANVNLLTPDDINDPIDGFPLLKSVQVKIKKMMI